MSRADEAGEQATLGQSIRSASQTERERATRQGAVYGRSQAGSEHVEHDVAEDHCRCGASLSAAVARCLGDNRGVVPACERCATNQYGNTISTTAKAVQLWFSERHTIQSDRGDEVVRR